MRPLPQITSLVGLVGLASCGAGAAGIAVGAGGSGGGSPAVLDSFTFTSPKESPGVMLLEATRPVRVGFFYDAGGGVQAMAGLRFEGQALPGNELDLPAGPTPVEWEFASQLSSSFTPGVRLLVQHGDKVLSGGELVVGLGNDAPVVHEVLPMPTDPASPDESTGNVEIRLRVSDSSSDVVNVVVKWRRSGDAPDAWAPATPAGVFPDGIETQPADEQGEGGVELSFFWNSFVDLAGQEDDVLFRVTADDRTEASSPRETTEPFRIDNNEEPIAQLSVGQVLANPDQRRGIPIPFRVLDEEEDLVQMIFQWRKEGEAFPALPAGEELDRVLADPELRREHQLCTSFTPTAEGRTLLVGGSPDGTAVRLPELASVEGRVLSAGIEGATLELLRASRVPESVKSAWTMNPLAGPVAALPVGDGLSAVVLDGGGGSGRLVEVRLTTGEARELARLAGAPTAMVFRRGGEDAVVVATDLGGTWRLEEVVLATGDVTELYTSLPGDPPPPVRGLESLGPGAALLTAGDALLHLDARDPHLSTLRSGLDVPWGLALEPLRRRQVYIAESGADRVLEFDLQSHALSPLVVDTSKVELLEPRSLALESGPVLLATTHPVPGESQVVGISLGTRAGKLAWRHGRTVELASLSTGPDGLRLATARASDDLLAGGGLEQRRTVVAYEPFDPDAGVGQLARLDAPLDPPPPPGTGWRLRLAYGRVRASADATPPVFPWDSVADVPAGGPVFLRAVARDTELGPVSEARSPKLLRAGLDVDPQTLPADPGLQAFRIAAGDLDDDGDLDLVVASIQNGKLVGFLQETPRAFVQAFALSVPGPVLGPRRIVVADLDGDGDDDLASENVSGNGLDGTVTVYFQEGPATFTEPPLVLGGAQSVPRLFGLEAADLDGDGDLDLVSTAGNLGMERFVVFLQSSPGVFLDPPQEVPSTTTFSGRVLATDLDGDGDVDLACTNAGTDDLRVLFQSAPGTFATDPLVLGGPTTMQDPVDLVAADLDGDGDVDLASANERSDELTLFFQTSSGRFADPPLVLGGPHLARPNSLAAADVDGDGDLDLAATVGSELVALLQSSPGAFDAEPLRLGGHGSLRRPLSVLAEDLDGDGRLDLGLVDVFAENDVTVYFQDAPGAFGEAPDVLGEVSDVSGATQVALGDVDGDGNLDVASSNSIVDRSLTVWLQSAPGRFAEPELVVDEPPSLQEIRSVGLADLDGDADLDLYCSNVEGFPRSRYTNVYLQQSPGSFASEPLKVGQGLQTSGATLAADVDGDGALDLVSQEELSLVFYPQVAPGAFADLPRTVGDTEGVWYIAAADVDADGDLDLATANGFADHATLFLQGDVGAFPGPPLVLGDPVELGDVFGLALADLDGDGDVDVVAGNLVAFFQNSPGEFSRARSLYDGIISGVLESLAACDLEGDGDVDLVGASGKGVFAYLQTAPRTYARPEDTGQFWSGFDSCWVVPGDLEGDGDLDLVATANGKPVVFWLGR